MSAINISKMTILNIQNTDKYRHKHGGIIITAKLLIGAFYGCCQIILIFFPQYAVFQHRLGFCHKKCRRYTFAGYIGNRNDQMPLIEQIKIIEVAAHIHSRIHCGINGKFLSLWKSRENIGQHIFLYPRCHFQFCTGMFLFCRSIGKIFHILFECQRHIVKAQCQMFHFVTGMYFQFFIKIACRNLLGTIGQTTNRTGHPAGHYAAAIKNQQQYGNQNQPRPQKRSKKGLLHHIPKIAHFLAYSGADLRHRIEHFTCFNHCAITPAR